MQITEENSLTCYSQHWSANSKHINTVYNIIQLAICYNQLIFRLAIVRHSHYCSTPSTPNSSYCCHLSIHCHLKQMVLDITANFIIHCSLENSGNLLSSQLPHSNKLCFYGLFCVSYCNGVKLSLTPANKIEVRIRSRVSLHVPHNFLTHTLAHMFSWGSLPEVNKKGVSTSKAKENLTHELLVPGGIWLTKLHPDVKTK